MQRLKQSLVSIIAAALPWTAALGYQAPEELVRALGSEVFQEREAAQAKLTVWAREDVDAAISGLLAIIAVEEDPEVGNRCLEVLKSLAEDDYLKEDGAKGFLGIGIGEFGILVPQAGPDRFGVIVTRADQGSPAADAGVFAGDVIVSVNGTGWNDPQLAPEGLRNTVGAIRPGGEATVKVLRGDKLLDFTVFLGRRPEMIFEGNGFFPLQGPDPAELEKNDREQFFKRWLLEKRPDE
jgi:predicted metalloprotease with PDZ domain